MFKVDQKGAYVDVGGKTTAFCAKEELSLAPIDRVRAAGGWRGFCKQWGCRTGRRAVHVQAVGRRAQGGGAGREGRGAARSSGGMQGRQRRCGGAVLSQQQLGGGG